MIHTTIAEIEESIRRAEALNKDEKAELLNLLAELRSEISSLSRTHREEAQTIAGLAKVSTQEMVQSEMHPKKSVIDELAASVAGFEGSHPHLVEVVNRICSTLANLGI